MNIKAKPTQYKGVTFRSKSEAIFARCLDLVESKWWYEPPSVCGHRWDFAVAPPHKREELGFDCTNNNDWLRYSGWVPRAKPCLIEYKPSQPTREYLDNLVAAMRSHPNRPIESLVIWGSPFKKICDQSYHCWPVFSTFSEKFGWGDYDPDYDQDMGSAYYEPRNILGIDELVVETALEYRFDLA